MKWIYGGGDVVAGDDNLLGQATDFEGREPADLETIKDEILNGGTYFVSFAYDGSGLISAILIDRR